MAGEKGKRRGGKERIEMYKIWFLVRIWKRSIFGFWYKAPVVRIAHADRAAAKRLGRLFTFEDLFGCGSAASVQQDSRVAPAAGKNRNSASTNAATVLR